MKVIFLDIDGVLNSVKTSQEWRNRTGKQGYGGYFREGDVCTDEHIKWGIDLVFNLRMIVEETGSLIVISSTWRNDFSLNKFKEMFAVYGWNQAPIMAKTPYFSYKHRGREIKKWLEDNQVDAYVILDDETDILEEQFQFWVNTDPKIGLSNEDVELAINVLNRGC